MSKQYQGHQCGLNGFVWLVIFIGEDKVEYESNEKQKSRGLALIEKLETRLLDRVKRRYRVRAKFKNKLIFFFFLLMKCWYMSPILKRIRKFLFFYQIDPDHSEFYTECKGKNYVCVKRLKSIDFKLID